MNYKILPYFAIVFFNLTIISCGSKDEKSELKKEKKPPAAVTYYVVQPQQIANSIFATGTLLPNEQVELRSEASGRIIALYFEEGNAVNKGQLLVKINDADYQAQLKKAKVALQFAKDVEQRQQKLLAIAAISQEDYDKAVNDLNKSEADVELLKALIDKTEIRAPFSGLVGLRKISNGEFVNSSTLIATLQQIDPLKIEFAVPEKYASQLKKGESVSFTVEGNDSIYTAQLYAIDNSINTNTRSIIVRGRTANGKLQLKAGAFAKVQLNLDEATNALMIPADVLIPGMSGQKVYVMLNGIALSRVVETGIRNENDIQIISGIAAGDTIITSGLLIMKDSLQVTAVK